jgi:predicted ATPase
LNREYFLPFISLLQRHSVVQLVQGEDFRARVESAGGCYHPSTPSLRATFIALGGGQGRERGGGGGGGDGGDSGNVQVPIANSSTRFLAVAQSLPATATLPGGAAWLSFSELCQDGERGASDYHALCDNFRTVCISDVPRLSVMEHDTARRFVVLVDILYVYLSLSLSLFRGVIITPPLSPSPFLLSPSSIIITTMPS